MKTIYKNAIVPYSAAQMFDLVNDINNYPSFLNWCSASNILSQNDNEIIASIKINKTGFSQEFTTKNSLIKNQKISIQLENGPFKSMEGSWDFTELRADACKIEFSLSFEFKSKIMDLTLTPVFAAIANSQLDSFIKRAKIIYG